MNDRIKQLAYKAGLHNHLWLDISDSDDVLDTVKFAQLIVRECAKIADQAEPYKATDLILKHFGVEQ